MFVIAVSILAAFAVAAVGIWLGWQMSKRWIGDESSEGVSMFDPMDGCNRPRM